MLKKYGQLYVLCVLSQFEARLSFTFSPNRHFKWDGPPGSADAAGVPATFQALTKAIMVGWDHISALKKIARG